MCVAETAAMILDSRKPLKTLFTALIGVTFCGVLIHSPAQGNIQKLRESILNQEKALEEQRLHLEESRNALNHEAARTVQRTFRDYAHRRKEIKNQATLKIQTKFREYCRTKPTLLTALQESGIQGVECLICLQPFAVSDTVSTLNCEDDKGDELHHPSGYHRDCIQKWFEIHPNCPCCRFEKPQRKDFEILKEKNQFKLNPLESLSPLEVVEEKNPNPAIRKIYHSLRSEENFSNEDQKDSFFNLSQTVGGLYMISDPSLQVAPFLVTARMPMLTSQKQALRICSQYGATLPSQDQYQAFARTRWEDQIRGVHGRWYWSSTVDARYGQPIVVFDPNAGTIKAEGSFESSSGSFFCVRNLP